MFEPNGGDLKGNRFSPFLEETVILPHNIPEDAFIAVVIFALVEGFAAAWVPAYSV